MRTGYWSKPKSLGYGATPVNWQGWAWTLGMALVIAVAVVIASLAHVQHWSDRRALQALCAVFGGAALLLVVIVARAKTDGEWRWRL
jgi:ABC-type cobalamin transport system permease subunit